ncbi:MFS transporter [Flavobacterium circumlabens]|nr:MFS transporter [Flavobacterium circumlabens]
MTYNNMKGLIRLQFSMMMFLEFFIWGMWYVTMGTYLSTILKATGLQIGAAYGMMAIATIISPLLIGIVADKFISPKKMFILLHLFGSGVLLIISKVTDSSIFNWVLLLYALLYAPTLALSSSLTFAQLDGNEELFPGLRVFGTLGWIIAGISIDQFFGNQISLSSTFAVAGIASIVLAVWTIFLPEVRQEIVENKTSTLSLYNSGAFSLFKNRSFSVFFIASALIAIPLSFYYSLTNQFLNEIGVVDAASKMTGGQFSEAFFILAIPFFLKKWGIKWMIVAGMIAWIIRFAFFYFGDASTNSWMLIVSILLHGLCYDFFFVAGQMYTDSMAKPENRNAAQAMITMSTYGVGMWIGSILSGLVANQNTINTTEHLWNRIWIVPAMITIVVLFLFITFFKADKKTKPKEIDI